MLRPRRMGARCPLFVKGRWGSRRPTQRSMIGHAGGREDGHGGRYGARAENDHGASAQSSPRYAMKGGLEGLLARSRIPHLTVRTETETVVRIFCPRDRERVQPRWRGALEGRACNGVRGEIAHSVLVKRWGVRVDVANDPAELNPSQRRDLSRLEIGGTADLRGSVTEVLPVEGRGVGDEEQARCPRRLMGRV